jgi:hypothetical protein
MSVKACRPFLLGWGDFIQFCVLCERHFQSELLHADLPLPTRPWAFGLNLNEIAGMEKIITFLYIESKPVRPM